MTEELVQVSSSGDEASAETLAIMLRTDGVPATVRVISPLPGVVEEVQVLAPKSLAHRAKWLIKMSKVSEEELRFAATGELGQGED